MLTIRQMEIFLAVCELQSISRASEALYMTQQGVSKAIKEIETEFGVALLDRTSHGMQPNEYGSYVLEESRQLLTRVNAMKANVNRMRRNSMLPLSLGASYGVIATLPAGFHREFRELNPNVELVYTDGPDVDMERRLAAGEFESAILLGPTEEPNLVVRPLSSERVFLCIPKGHPLFEREQVSMADLIGQSFVMFSENFRIAQHFTEACHYAGFEPWIELRSSDFNSLKELALLRGELFVVPEHTVVKDSESFRYVPFPDANFRWTMYYAMRRNKVVTAPMLSMENLLNKYFPPENFI